MTSGEPKKPQSMEIEDLQPESFVELTEEEAEQVEGGLLPAVHPSGANVVLADGSVRFHNYKTQGTLGEEQVIP